MKRLPILLLLLSCAIIICAAPARRGFFNKQLPDGTVVKVRLVGDEFSHAFLTEKGQLMQEDEDGSLVPTTWDVFYQQKRANKVKASAPAYRMKDFPTEGEVRGAVLLVSFSDLPFTIPDDSIRNLLTRRFNAEHYSEEISFAEYSKAYDDTLRLKCTIPGSARDYFKDQSYGKFCPSFDVFGPVQLDTTLAYYGGNGRKGAGGDVNVRKMMKEACLKIHEKGKIDFSRYDSDDDGYVDFIYIVYAGFDEAQYGGPNSIWAKSWTLDTPLELDGIKLSRFACSAELTVDVNVVAGVGTFVHEMSHILGLPDFYNVNDINDFAMSCWSIMDYGMYTAEGFAPQGYTSFERYSLGWIPMQTLSEPDTVALRRTDDYPTGWRTFVSDNDTTAFYIFENIQRNEPQNDSIWGNWFRYSPTYGLMITCVNYESSSWVSNHVNSSKDKHRYYIVPANDSYVFDTENKQLFGTENHSFGPSTTPPSITSFGITMDKPLTGITSEKGGLCRFNFNGYVDTSVQRDLPATNDEEEIIYFINSAIRIVRKGDRVFKQLNTEGIFSH